MSLMRMVVCLGLLLASCDSRSAEPASSGIRSNGPTFGSLIESGSVIMEVNLRDSLKTVQKNWVISNVRPEMPSYVLPRLVEVYGVVRLADAVVPADVTFSRVSDGSTDIHAADAGTLLSAALAGVTSRPSTVSVRNTNALQGKDNRPYDFLAYLLPGHYTVTVTPVKGEGQSVPPWTFALDITDADSQRYDIQYPATPMVFSGRMVTKTGSPKNGMVVQAINDQGDAISTTERSGANGADPGEFLLRLSPLGTIKKIRVSSSEEEQLPQFDVDLTNLVTAHGGAVEILVPSAPPTAEFSGTVVYGAEKHPVGSTSILFQTDTLFDPVTKIKGPYAKTIKTDDEGAFSVTLPESAYRVVLIPPTDSNAAVLATNETISRASVMASGHRVYELSEKVAVTGTVAGSASTKNQFTVQANALNIQDDGRIVGDGGLFNRSSQSVTRTDGGYMLVLDEGMYDVVFKPPASSNLSWSIRTDVVVALSSTQQIQNVESVDGTVVVGSLLDSSGTVVQGAEITMLVAAETAGKTRLVPLGQTTTDTFGNYSVAVASRLK